MSAGARLLSRIFCFSGAFALGLYFQKISAECAG